MAKVYLEDSSLTNIANSIRTKLGTTTTYKPNQMSAAIDSIETGGGGSNIISEYLNFCSPFDSVVSKERIDVSKAITNDSYVFATTGKLLYTSSSKGVSNGICYGYIKIDSRKAFTTLNILSYASSESNWDFGCFYITKDIPTSYPNYQTIKNATVGSTIGTYGTLIGKGSGQNIRIDIVDYELRDDIYYLVYGYCKDSSGNNYDDCLYIEDIKIKISNVYDANKFKIPTYSEAETKLKDFITQYPFMYFDFSNFFKNISFTFNMNNVGKVKVYKADEMFYGFSGGLGSSPDFTNWDFSECISAKGMFYGLSWWHTSTLDLGNLDFSKCMDTTDMFNSVSSSYNITCPKFENIQNGYGMFANISKSVNIKNMNISKLKTFNLFRGYNSSLNFNELDFSNIENMDEAFYEDVLITRDLSNVNWGVIKSFKKNTFKLYGNYDFGKIKFEKDSALEDTSFSGNFYLRFTGNSNFSDVKGSATLNLTNWNNGASGSFYTTFANSLANNNSGYTRTIKLNSNLYSSLTADAKAILTNKGYTLTS